MRSARLACAWYKREGESLVSMWKVVRTELKEARRMMPERRKEIWRDQARVSRVGRTYFARRERMRFIGSLVLAEKSSLGDNKNRRRVVREVLRMRKMQ